MSFYDDASLVVIPSAQKTSKLYAVKPTDGSGDLTFTRTGDTASRVNSAGLIERVRTNVILQSQTFDNASWLKSLVGGASAPVVTANNTTAPDGTLTADKIVFVAPTSGDISQVTQNITLTGIANGSVYLKAFAAGDVGKILAVRFNSGSYALVTLTADWQRFSVSQTAIVGTFDIALRPAVGSSSGTVSVYAWGAQLEAGDIATPYIMTLTAAVSTGPTANVPRLDYLGSTCPRLLLEPQRTNLLQFSEQIDNAYWTKQDASITANTSVSPDGYTNADSLIENSATAQHLVMRTGITITNATAYTASVYFKANTRTRAAIQLAGAGFFDTANGLVIFNLSTGTIVSQSGNATGTITAMGNGWYRCTATKTSVGTSGVVAFNLVDSSNNISYAGNGTSGIFLWGAQLEAGAYATSYIPTLAASATRGADLASKSGISSLIGQTNGTAQMKFVMDFDTSGDSTTMLGIHAGTSTANRIQLTSRFGTVRLLVIANNSIVTNDLLYDAAPNEVVNVAFKYGSAGVTAYVNGTQRYTTASAVVFTETMTLFTIGNRSGIDDYGKGQRVSQSLLFNSALTNAQLAELTAL